MVTKTNLSRRSITDESLKDSPIQIIPESSETFIVYEQDIKLNPGKEFSATPNNCDQEVFYVLAGNGEISTDSIIEIVEGGDRIVFDIGSSYVIRNSGIIPLHFILIGIKKDR